MIHDMIYLLTATG